MNAPIPQRRRSRLTQPLPPRTTARIFGGLALAALLFGGGWWIYQRYDARHRSPEEVRAMIRKFLQKQTDQKEFKTEATVAMLSDPAIWELPPPVATNISTLITNLIGGTNRISIRNIRRILSAPPPPENKINGQFRSQINAAMDYKTMYRMIGEHLWLVDQLLEDAEPKRHAAGVEVAAEVGRVALSDACSPWLAARVCEGYLWPQMEFAESNKMRLDPDMLMAVAEDAFRGAGETNNLIHSYKLLVTKAPQSNRADKARIRLAALLEQQGELTEALKYYKEVKNQSSRIRSRISSLESRIQRKAKG